MLPNCIHLCTHMYRDFLYPAMTHVRLASFSLSIQSFMWPSISQASVLYSSFTQRSRRINVILMLYNWENWTVLLLGFECSHLGQMRTERSWPHAHICYLSPSLAFSFFYQEGEIFVHWMGDFELHRGGWMCVCACVCVRERLVDWALVSCQNHTQTIPH